VLAGPLFTREVLTAPRSIRHFVLRAGYVFALFVLMYTAGQATFGWRPATGVAELGRFGNQLFQMFSAVQLALVLFFAPLFAASRVAQEKDRQTLVLLLMTDLRSAELVLGKLGASLLAVAVLLLASAPVLALVYVLGGCSAAQIGWSLAFCAAAGLAAGSWGSLVAFWRDKTFQTLAISLIGLALFIGVVEALIALLGGTGTTLGRLLSYCDPFRGMALILDPLAATSQVGVARVDAWPYVVAMLVLALILNVIAIARLRIWNPNRTMNEPTRAADDETAGAASPVAVRSRDRQIWDNPVLWREICTRAYGRMIIVVRVAWFVLFGVAVAGILREAATPRPDRLAVAVAVIPMALASLVAVTALAVTSVTTERDRGSLDILLVSDLEPGEFVWGKLLGVLAVAREIVILPVLLCGALVWTGIAGVEGGLCLAAGMVLLSFFAAVLGFHCGLSYDSSRRAIAVALGTVTFLFVGVATAMRIMVAFGSSFELQLAPFLAVIVGGAVGLYAALSARNPSPAIAWTSALLPGLTFVAITSFLQGNTLQVLFVVTAAYGFATAALLVPAIGAFDLLTGRTTTGD